MSERPRAAWGSLSRDQVVDAALAAVHRDGFERFTIRSLAADLGVAPMSLYRHVADKDDLIADVVDKMLRRRWRPRADPRDWRAYTTEAAERLRAFLAAEPAALHIYLRRPIDGTNALERMRTMREVLVGAGLDADEAHRAYASIHTYTLGFAALAAARASAPIASPRSAAQRELARFTAPAQFREGLADLIAGIDRRRS